MWTTAEVNDCLFCRIVRGEIPAKVVLDDTDILAFEDINPQAPTHVLVIPRRHIPSLAGSGPKDTALLGRLLAAAREIAAERGLADGFRVVTNNGALAGQTVHHLHFHLLGGREFQWPPG